MNCLPSTVAASPGAQQKPQQVIDDAGDAVVSAVYSGSSSAAARDAALAPPRDDGVGSADAATARDICESAAIASDGYGQRDSALDSLIKRSRNVSGRRVFGDSAGAVVRRRQMR